MNQNSGYGQALLSNLANQVGVIGNIHIVMDVDDTDEKNYQHMQDLFPPDEDGNARFFTTVAAAYAACESNNNDVILLDSNSSHPITEMLTVAKNRVHFVGMDGGGRIGTGHGTRLVMGVTTEATDLAVVKVTGTRCSFSDIKFESSNTKDESLYALIDAGSYTLYKNCSVLKLTDLDEATAADVIFAGVGTDWIECEFGAATVLATAARPVAIIDKSLAGSVGMMDNHFLRCTFVSYTDTADRRFITLVANQDGQRYAMFRSCAFINWDLIGSGTTMTDAISAVNGNTNLYMVFDANTIVVGCTNFATATDNDGVYICAPVPTAATSGIAVNAA